MSCFSSRVRLRFVSQSVVGDLSLAGDLELATAHHAAKCGNLAHGIARVFAVIVTMLRMTEPIRFTTCIRFFHVSRGTSSGFKFL